MAGADAMCRAEVFAGMVPHQDCALVIVLMPDRTVSAAGSPLHPAFGAIIPLIPAEPAQS